MIGLVEKKNLILRGGAKINDIIFLTGELGDLGSKKQFYFKPCLEEARYLVRNYRINSMIDISDGLALDLSHILKESNVGAVIYEKLIPVSKSGCEIKTALSKGEEFELLFSVAPKEAKRLINAKKKIYTAIGQIVDRRYGFRLITADAKEKAIEPRGFSHF
jgi:thiamine-monophosphate kinase